MKKLPVRALLGFVALNLFLGVFAWLLTSHGLERLEIRTESPSEVLVYSGFAGLDGKVDGVRTVPTPGGSAPQLLKLYFAGGCDLSSLTLGFKNESDDFSVVSVVKLSSLLLRKRLDLSSFYEGCQDGRVEFAGGKLVFAKGKDFCNYSLRDGRACAWHYEWQDNKQVVILFLCLEFALLVVSLIGAWWCSRKRVNTQKYWWFSLLVSLLFALYLVLGLPVQTFLANQSEFSFGLGALLIDAAVPFFVILLLSFAALTLSYGCFGYLPHAYMLVVVVYAYLEVGVLSIGLPSLNGDVYYFGRNTTLALWDNIVIVSLAVLPILLYRWIKGYVGWIVLAVGVLCLASMFDVRVDKSSGLVADNPNFCPKIDVAKSAAYSPKRNLLLFILDSSTAEITADIVNERPEIREHFPGFVQYRNNVGMYPCTGGGVPGIMTGLYADGDFLSEEYGKTIFSEKSFIDPYLKDGIPIYLLPGIFTSGFTNRRISEDAMTAQRFNCWLKRTEGIPNLNLLEIVRFRITPYKLKSTILGATFLGITSLMQTDSESVLFPYLRSAKVVDDLPMTVHTYLTLAAHVPVNRDRRGNRLSKPNPNYGGAFDQTYYALSQLGTVMDALRTKNVYDNSLIIVCADHGENATRRTAAQVAKLSNRALPMLWVKPEQAKGVMDLSMIPTSQSKIASLCLAAKDVVLSRTEIEKIIYSDKRKYFNWYTEINAGETVD